MVQRKRDAEPHNAAFCNTEKLNTMIRIKTLLTIILALGICYSYGQNLKGNVGTDDSHSSNAPKGSGTGLVGVDLFTGTGSVNIPLFGQNISGLDLGIGLSYAAKGIRVNERAGSVGLGFELSSGGSITRDVNGLEDEVTMRIKFATNDSLKGCLVYGAHISDAFDDYADDMEQDLFHFDLAGRNIDVAFKRSGSNITYQTFPYSEIKITLLIADSGTTSTDAGPGRKTGITKNHNILIFQVVDEKGNTYYYGRGDYRYKKFSFKHWIFDIDTGTYYPTEKWNLDSVKTWNGLIVRYEYQQYYTDFLKDVTETLFPREQEYDVVNQTVGYDPLEIKEDRWQGIITHIKKISYPNGITVDFDLDSSRCDCRNTFRAKGFKISRRINDTQKDSLSIVFNQAYFQTPVYNKTDSEIALNSSCSSMASALTVPSGINTDSARKMYLSRGLRLKLKSIDKYGMNNSTYETIYSFDYNSKSLPYRFSAQQDFYGYYNADSPFNWYGRDGLWTPTNGETYYLSIPYHYDINYYSSRNVYTRLANGYWGAKRTHNFTAAQAFSITGIKNCSGGKDSIVYTPYSLRNPSCSYGFRVLTGYNGSYGAGAMWYDSVGCYIDSLLIGDTVNDGLCVGKIISKDGFNAQHTTTTEYTYDSSERFNRGGYMYYFDSAGHKVLTNYFVSPDNYYDGSNHGFSKVTITSRGYAGQQLSKQVCYFTNNLFVYNGHDSTSIRRPTDWRFLTMPPDFLKYRVGLPLKTQTYDQSNNLMSEVTNSYDYISRSPEIINSRVYSYSANNVGYWRYHVIDNEAMRLKTVVTKSYVSTRILSDTVTYSYDDDDFIRSVTTKDSRGDKYKTYNYNAHILYNELFIGGFALAFMTDYTQIPLISKKWKMNGTNDSSLISADITTPDCPGFIGNAAGFAFAAHYSTVITEPLTASHANSTSYFNLSNAMDPSNTSGAGSALLRDKRVTFYDLYNYMGLENKLLNQDFYTSCIYDTKTRQIIASATNAKYADIAFTSFESTYNNRGVFDYNKGNWDFDPGNITTAGGGITGGHSCLLNASTKYINSRSLLHKKYLLTFWMNSSQTTPPVNLPSGAVTCTLQNTVGSWKLYSAVVAPDSGDVLSFNGVSTNVYYLDEIRLHPLDAAMTTCTYTPLAGIASVTNASNIISYYEYDLFGRPSIIRDMRGKIIKKMEAVCGDSNQPNNGGPSAPGGNYTKWDFVPNP
jgi:hypothetical protein